MKIGAYAVEQDYSQYVAHAAKTIFAVVGTATKGPIGVPTVCTSIQDFVNKFGPLKTGSYGLYAGQYFLSQSSKLYFVRAASLNAKEATVTIAGLDTNDERVENALTLTMLEKGTYSNTYVVEVTAGVTDTTGTETYNLTLKSAAPGGSILETLKNVSLKDLVVGKTTKYFKISSVNSTAISLVIDTETPPVYQFSGGHDGDNTETGTQVEIGKDEKGAAIYDDGKLKASSFITAANTLLSDTIDMNLFAVPGVSDASVICAMLSIAETRGDCLYLVDPPKGLDRDGVINWHNGGEEYEHAAFNSSYGALYYDWVTIYDSVNKTNVEVPPSVVVAATYAYSDRTSDVWYAPAGLTRGIVRGALNAVTDLSKTDIEYMNDGTNCVNPIYNDPQVGLVLWGQKTLLRTATALDRVNVRRMLNYLKRVITAACNYLTFEPNDRITWNSFVLKIDPVLQAVQQKRGISEYSIVKGESIVTTEDIENYRMPCMIMIRPTKSAEEIPIYFTLTSAGADFNEVLSMTGVN